MLNFRPLILFFTLAFLATFHSHAQKSTSVGLNFTLESASGIFRPGFGAKIERKLTRRSGIETGLYYRNYIREFYIDLTGSETPESFLVTVSERHLSIPVLYKFYSRLINISMGPTFDFYLGWRERNESTGLLVNDYNIDPDFSIGLMGKISKSISLTDKIFLEPEVRYSYNFTFDRTYAGFGIAAQYKFH